MITRTEYAGWAHNVKLSNGRIELIATLDVGPRLLRFAFIDGANVMKEFPEHLGGCHEPDWVSRGGHRLWHAPEAIPRTYAPDNAPVSLEELDDFAIRLTPPPETANGIQKQLEVRMGAETDEVTVVHRLTNVGAWEITLAPWALSVMDAGGTAIIPLPEKRPHTEVLTPDFPLVLWPYTDLSDSRLSLGRRYITFAQDSAKGPAKFGMPLQLGWAAYLVHQTLFVKYFDYLPDAVYPDFGCSFEAFSNEAMLEVESLGPLAPLAPGETVEHVETWRIFANVPAITDEASIDRIIRPLVEQSA
ncbi:MAG TPA: hypothetical protein VGL77_16255 [Armatimonadota bacterium]|jgi:hypothetical protein